MSGGNQDWRTPDDFYRMLDVEVGGFDIDVAACPDDTKCANWIGIAETKKDGAYFHGNALETQWFDPEIAVHNGDYDPAYSGGIMTAWCNPPYGRVTRHNYEGKGYDLNDWVQRAIEQVNKYPGAVAYMLLNNSADPVWYKTCVEHASEMRILIGGRIQFVAPEGVKVSSNSKSQVLIVFRKKQPSAPCHVWHWDWQKDMDVQNVQS